MLDTIGLPELLIIAAIAVIVWLPLRVRGAAITPSERLVGVASFISSASLAVADERYAGGLRTGKVAELFGIGRHGVRWTQVLVVTAGVWIAGNNPLGTLRTALDSTGLFEVVSAVATPVAFVASAIIAIRSFQNALGIALCTSTIYTVVMTAWRIAAAARADYWSLAALSSFAWSTLIMLALQWAMSGTHSWWRMVTALVFASLLNDLIRAAIWSGEVTFNPAFLAATGLLSAVSFSLTLTGAFWLASLTSRG